MPPKLLPLSPTSGGGVIVMVEEEKVEVDDKLESEVMVAELVVTLTLPMLDNECL